jgi:hypothetical protein
VIFAGVQKLCFCCQSKTLALLFIGYDQNNFFDS